MPLGPTRNRTRRPRKVEPARSVVINPGRGLNNFVSENLIKDEEMSDLLNIVFDESGVAKKRGGITTVGSGLPAAPKGLGVLKSDTVNRLLTVSGTALYYLNGSTWDSIAGETFTADKETTFTQARGKAYIWNGTEGGTEYDGTTLDRPGTMPKARFSIYYSGYHIAAGVDTQKNRLYISVATDASDFTNAATTLHNSTEVPGATVFAGTGAQFVDVEKDDGDEITGLTKFQDALIVFKRRSIHQVTFDSSGVPTVAAVTRSVGCESHKSIENVENDVFFFSRNGYYVLGNEPQFFDAIRTNELSARIHPLIGTINRAQFSRVSSIYFDNRFWSAVPQGGNATNNQVLTYDRRYFAWSKHDTITPNHWTVYVDSNNLEHLYYADETQSEVFEVTDSTYSDDGQPIAAHLTTKAFDLGNFDIYKQFLSIRLLFRSVSGVVGIKVYTDGDSLVKETTINPSSGLGTGSTGTGLFGEVLMGGEEISAVVTTTTNVPYEVPVNKKARTIKVQVSNDRNTENFVLLGIVVTYVPYSPFLFPSANKLY